ncbi:unnamed protein product [Pleuronectes platessa]|uniref:Uncharacterized protein n=1 Tax=Pleuronectes platessa TaxID=8262 RepID=A0A9N7VFG6_PLEPL|nr:unnamed protein product [Pleuronectes platessa]
MENVSGVFWLMKPPAPSRRHTILPADIRFTGTLRPADSGSRTPSLPHTEYTALIISGGKAIQVRVRKLEGGKNGRSGEMHRNDTLPYLTALNSDTAENMRRGINNIFTVAAHASEQNHAQFSEEVIYFTYSPYGRVNTSQAKYKTATAFNLESVRNNSSVIISVIWCRAAKWSRLILKPVADI